jgi:hypothetical protein
MANEPRPRFRPSGVGHKLAVVGTLAGLLVGGIVGYLLPRPTRVQEKHFVHKHKQVVIERHYGIQARDIVLGTTDKSKLEAMAQDSNVIFLGQDGHKTIAFQDFTDYISAVTDVNRKDGYISYRDYKKRRFVYDLNTGKMKVQDENGLVTTLDPEQGLLKTSSGHQVDISVPCEEPECETLARCTTMVYSDDEVKRRVRAAENRARAAERKLGNLPQIIARLERELVDCRRNCMGNGMRGPYSSEITKKADDLVTKAKIKERTLDRSVAQACLYALQQNKKAEGILQANADITLNGQYQIVANEIMWMLGFNGGGKANEIEQVLKRVRDAYIGKIEAPELFISRAAEAKGFGDQQYVLIRNAVAAILRYTPSQRKQVMNFVMTMDEERPRGEKSILGVLQEANGDKEFYRFFLHPR